MYRLFAFLALAMLSLTGCGSSPVGSENAREVVLQYLGGDVGTAGPYGRNGKKELVVLSDADRRRAESLIDDGAVLFLVFGTDPGTVNQPSHVMRVVMLQKSKIVADFKAVNPNAQPGP